MTRIALRWMSAVVALVLLPSLASDLLGLGCPHHIEHEAAHPGAAAGDEPGAGHRAAHAGGHDAGEGALPPPCTCVGNCPTSAGPSALLGRAATAAVLRATVFTPSAPAAQRVAVPRAPYALPFANGPPLA